MAKSLQVRLAQLDLPAPLPALLQSVLRAGEDSRRHELLIGAWEATLQILGCAGLAAARGRGLGADNLEAAAAKLKRPSLGHWAQLIRATKPLMAEIPELKATGEALARPYNKIEGLVALVDAIKGAPPEIQEPKTVKVQGRSVASVLDAMVSYRNFWCSGHYPQDSHAAAKVFRDGNADALLEGLLELLEAMPPLGEFSVVVASELKRDASGYVAQLTRMHGSTHMPEVHTLPREVWDKLEHGHPYLFVAPHDFVALYPLAAAQWQGTKWAFGWVNGSDRKTTVQYRQADGRFNVVVEEPLYRKTLGEPSPDAAPVEEATAVELPAKPPSGASAGRVAALLGVVALGAGAAFYFVGDDEPTPVPAAPAPTGMSAADAAPPIAKPEPKAEPKAPTPPEGMVYVEAGEFSRGTADWERAYKSCRNSYKDECSSGMFEREAQGAGPTKVEAFFLDLNEVTNAELGAWINAEFKTGGLKLLDEVVRTADDRAMAMLGLAPAKQGQLKGIGFRAFDVSEGSLAPAEGAATRPASLLRWELADRYCKAAGKRLPTEAEWEYAARGPESLEYVWGDKAVQCEDLAYGRLPLATDASYVECSEADKRPETVGSSTKDVSWCGAQDMGGNVSEWVADAFAEPKYKCVTSTPSGDDEFLCHLFKGGSWMDPLKFSRPATRNVGDHPKLLVRATIGFRCAQDLP